VAVRLDRMSCVQAVGQAQGRGDAVHAIEVGEEGLKRLGVLEVLVEQLLAVGTSPASAASMQAAMTASSESCEIVGSLGVDTGHSLDFSRFRNGELEARKWLSCAP